MKKHVLFVCLSYTYFGFGIAVENFGIKAGLGLTTTLIIWVSSISIFFVMVFTSFEKIKRVLYKKEEPTT